MYYTPRPVVSYIVRSIDHLLKTDFNLGDGLADASRVTIKIKTHNEKDELETRELKTHKVLILDPAVGTGTFLYEVVTHVYETFSRNRGMWSNYVSDHLLPRMFGFELLMAPYAVAHLKLGMKLAETKYDFKANERLRIYLTNALEEVLKLKEAGGFTRWLVEEASAANDVKQDFPVMVVLGNPPYSGHSFNKGNWIANLLRGVDTRIAIDPEAARQRSAAIECANYFEVDGKPLDEKNPKWINNDYVKFIRFAQWRIEQTGYGILAFITDNSYLDSSTLRGMRQSLIQTFDEIYVLDLHGNSNKKERSPDGSKDENVFDIRQGVAIGIFVKRKKNGQKQPASVQHADLWGVREVRDRDADGEPVVTGGKYHWLWQNEVGTTKWNELSPQSPFYLFTPHDTAFSAEYEIGWKMTDVFTKKNMGITTGRDSFATNYSEEELKRRIADLAGDEADAYIREKYGLEDSSSFSLRAARTWSKGRDAQSSVVPVAYRCFDTRYVIYSPAILARAREDIFSHQIGHENKSLVTFRAIRELPWNHAFIANAPVTKEYISSLDNCFVFPLYVYPKKTLFDLQESPDAGTGRRPNLAPKFIADLAARIKLTFIPDCRGDLTQTFGPEDVFDYFYAVLHSASYRTRYSDFLKIDFPRLPLTSNVKLFVGLCGLGRELASVHLMEKTLPIVTTYPVEGNNRVERVHYVEPRRGAEGRVFINKKQFFEGVAPCVWEFHIGGYQVCHKWLKDRKGCELTAYDELMHYHHIVSALARTMELMVEIDQAIDASGGWPMR